MEAEERPILFVNLDWVIKAAKQQSGAEQPDGISSLADESSLCDVQLGILRFLHAEHLQPFAQAP